MHAKRRGLLSSILLLPLTVFAQSSEEDELAQAYGDKAFVSIATGARQPLSRAPAVTSVITAEDISKMGATDLASALEMVTGMHVGRGAFSYTPIYIVRGIYNATNIQILILLNGVPYTTPVSGGAGAQLGSLPLEHVARIEIIRGPASALYGADAYSGVINVITKTNAEVSGLQIGSRLGSFRSKDAWLQYGGKIGGFDIASYLRVGSTDGSKEIVSADAQTGRDIIFGTHASLAPGPLNTGSDKTDFSLDLAKDQWRWRLNYIGRDNIGSGAGIASALDPIGKNLERRLINDLSWTDLQLAAGWGAGVQISYVQLKQGVSDHLRLSPPGTRLPTGLFPDGQIGHPEIHEHQLRGSAFVNYSGLSGHKLRLGLGHDDLDLYRTVTIKNYVFNAAAVPTPTGPIANYSEIQPFLMPQRRKLNYIYLQDEWQLANDWTITSGIRHDRYSDFGSTTNPRLAVVWKASYTLTAKLLYGSAFRAPAISEAYSLNNPVLRGNPNLQPETIRTLEAALSWQMRPDTQWNINIFQYRMKDIISGVPNAVAGVGAIYANVGSQKGSGLELELRTDAIKDWHFNANYAYQHSTNLANGADAGYAPHHHFYLRADWKFSDQWQASTQINYVGDRRRTFGDKRPAVADYTSVDLSLRSNQLAGHWQLSASIRNLFNADIREPSLAPGAIPNDLPQPRRNAYLQASYSF